MSKETLLGDDTRIAIFKKKEIRKALHNGEWWFSVIDIVEALTESANARDYRYQMKTRMSDEEGTQLSTVCRQLKLRAPDGKLRETDCADTEGIFRIIQSIPSPKAEPFKIIGQLVGVIPAKAGIQVSHA